MMSYERISRRPINLLQSLIRIGANLLGDLLPAFNLLQGAFYNLVFCHHIKCHDSVNSYFWSHINHEFEFSMHAACDHESVLTWWWRGALGTPGLCYLCHISTSPTPRYAHFCETDSTEGAASQISSIFASGRSLMSTILSCCHCTEMN